MVPEVGRASADARIGEKKTSPEGLISPIASKCNDGGRDTGDVAKIAGNRQGVSIS